MSTRQQLATAFISRSKEQGLKSGLRRDKAALEFFIGAASYAKVIGDELAFGGLGFDCSMICVRGARYVEELAAKAPGVDAG